MAHQSFSVDSNSKPSVYVYESPLANVVTRLRAVSLTTGIIGSVGLPIVLAMKGEVPSAGYLGLAMAFVGSVNSLSSFLVQLVFPWELSNLGPTATFAILFTKKWIVFTYETFC